MAEWKTCKLSDLGDIVGGATPSTKDESNYGGDIPWITPKDLSNFNGRYINRGERNITEKGLRGCSTVLLPANSILFSSRAPIGYVAIAANPVCTNQGFKSVVPNTETDSMFLYYLMLYNRNNIEALGSGTTFKEVSGSTMRNVEVRVPVDIETQKRIASVLSSIDEKIETNQRINDNLEQQAIALFNNAYESATSEAPFTSVAQVLSGGTPKTDNESFWNGAIPFFTPKDVGTPYTLTTEKYITDDGLAHCNSRLYPTNTTFVTARGTVGKVSLAGCPMAMNQSCYALGGISIHPLLVYCYTLQVIDALKHKATDAVFDAITVRDFNAESIKRIDCDHESNLLSMIEPMFNSILTNSMENQRLMTLRDTLLPRLMSGEIDVSAIDLGC